jgi:trk system potassium uptake protein TrkA
MAPSEHEDILIVGCGRVGVELAGSINRQSHHVIVLDSDPRAFDRLGQRFRGRTVLGDALDNEALRRAGIEGAHGLAAVTGSDSVNIVVARLARDLFKVEHVVARVYEPSRAPIYEMLGLPAVASTAWSAQRMEQLLLHPGLRSVYAAGNGEVQVYEVSVPVGWRARALSELSSPDAARVVAVSRGGRALLPAGDFMLQPMDVLLISATAQGAAALRQWLQVDGKG